MAKWYISALDLSLNPSLQVVVAATTSALSSLWLLWGYSPPQRVRRAVIRRGVVCWDDPKWVLPSTYVQAQEEPGLTLVHTFTIDPQPRPVTIHFYFQSNPVADDSPSYSPFYQAFIPTCPLPPVFFTPTFQAAGSLPAQAPPPTLTPSLAMT